LKLDKLQGDYNEKNKNNLMSKKELIPKKPYKITFLNRNLKNEKRKIIMLKV